MALIRKLSDPNDYKFQKSSENNYDLKQVLNFKKWPVIFSSIVSYFGILVLDKQICQYQTIC